MSPRVVWKGAITFGLVHVPVALHPASQEGGVDFDWLDRRSMDPVGYQRINKRTGRAVRSEDIVRGVPQEDGQYVLLSDAQIRAAQPESSQAIEIEAFVRAAEVAFPLLEKPYYLEPLEPGGRLYALLREALREAGVIGVARVVLHLREHLAVLVPLGPVLMLNTIRWASEIRPPDDLRLPPAGAPAAGVQPQELALALQLIGAMTRPWQPEIYEDRFVSRVQALVQRKREAGELHSLAAPEPPPAAAAPAAQVLDLSELLARSLAERQGGGAAKGGNGRTRGPPAGGARRRA